MSQAVMTPWCVIFSHPAREPKPQTPQGSVAVKFASPQIERRPLSLVESSHKEVEGA